MAVVIPNNGMPTKGQFSPPAGVRLDGQFLNAAQASRYSGDPIFRKHYYCNLMRSCTFGSWLTENMGYDTTCYRNWSLVREYPTDHIVHLSNATPVIVPASPGTAVLSIAARSHFVSGNYVYPQVGDALLLPPDGVIAIITAVTAGVNSTTLTVRLKNSTVAVTVPALADVIVLTGKQLSECDCPTGRLRMEDAPVEQPIALQDIGESTDQICGNALLACQNVKYAYQYMDEKGCLVETDVWYGGELSKLYQRHEESKFWQYLFDPTFGIITTLRSKSVRWTWADQDNPTVLDIADLKSAIQRSGINCFEYSFVVGSKAFSALQTLANTLATGRVSYGAFGPEEMCKMINLNFCTIAISGMIIHFYEECSFSDRMKLGAAGFNYGNRGIGMPMCDKPSDCQRRGDNDTKLFTVVNFKDQLGRVWDNLVDSNGILNGPGGRNTFGTGCDFHEWSIKSSFAVEVSCPEAWVLLNFPA